MRRLSTVAFLAGLMLVVVATATPVYAQRQLGAIQGTITDQTGGVIPGVTVTVTNKNTGEVRNTVTNEVGIYRLPGLDPGTYDVAAELSGLGRGARNDVVVSVGASVGLNMTLSPAGVSETVQVLGVSPDIQTEKADLSSVVERQRIVDLPIAGRNPLTLATLQPGILGLPGGTDFLAQEQGMGFNASGQRSGANNAMVDGLSINGGPWSGSVLIVPNTEAVQEFQVVANNPSAEFGRNSGAAVSLVTRGGTNQFRGSGFTFYRSNEMRALTYFEKLNNAQKADFKKQDFGGSLGGPIRRDSAFFFFSYEGVREDSGSGAQYTVETEQFRDFVKSTRPNSNAAYLLDKYRPPVYPTTGLRDLGSPAPGVRVIGPPDGIPDIGTINYAIVNHREGDQFNGRFDQVLRSGNDKLRASYYMTDIKPEFTYLRPGFDHPYPHRNQFLSLGYTSVVSSTTLNELSFGYVRMHGEAQDPTPDAPTISVLGGVSGFGVDFWHPIQFTQNNFEIKETLTTTRGRHSLRFGGEARLSIDNSELHHWERPNYEFQTPLGVSQNTGILDFADDEAFSERRGVDPATGLPTLAVGEYRGREFALYMQDNWKVRSNVTVNLGLRYEVFMSPKKVNRSFGGIILGPGATRQEQVATAKVGEIPRLYDTDWNNFGPRLGVAWDLGGNGKTVLRTGGGLSYNRINNTVWSDERLNPPFFANAFATVQDNIPIVYTLGPDYPPNPALNRGFDENGGLRGARIDLRVIDPATTLPYSYNWFAGVQRQLPWDFVVEANYIGSAGRNLMSADGPGGEDYNRFAGDMLDNVRNRLNPSFGVVGLAESRIDSNYHGLTLQANRRFRRGFSFQAAYTLGQAKDYPGVAEEVTDLARDYGNAAFDVRQKLALNVLWQIPYEPANLWVRGILGGWQLNTITIWQTGQPFTVTCNSPYPTCDFNADGNNGDRVNLPSYGTDLGSISDEQWLAGGLNASDFPLPESGTLGTLPRNVYYGPSYFTTDFSLFKNIEMRLFGSDTQTLQLRIEAYNLFDTLNLNNPVTNTAAVNFGVVTSLRTPGGGLPGSRLAQVGLKFLF
jgi:Carboxypeptidase regulatory-like domain